MAEVVRETRRDSVEVPAGLAPFARLPVLVVAGVTTALLLALAGRFGYFGDELYFLASGTRHPEWGYADNPWLLPQLAALSDALFPGSVVALRVLPALLTGAGIVLCALLAREFGGGRRAQVLAAVAYALSFQLLASGHVLATSTVDPPAWVLVCWLLCRWLRTRSDRLLLVAGLVTAVAMQGKFLIVFYWVAIGAAALLFGPRDLLRRPALWLGAAVTVALTVPTLIWQAANGWPYLAMGAVVAEQNQRLLGGQLMMIPLALLMSGLLVGVFLACHGLWQLLTAKALREYRILGWAVVFCTVLFVVFAARYYYLAGLYAVLFAASAARLDEVRPARWWRWVPTWPVVTLSAVLAVWVALPVRSESGFTGITVVDFVASGSYGWPELVDTVDRGYRTLPESGREHTVVMGDTYWQAAALDVYGPERGLPAAYGPERGYFYLGRPPAETERVVYAGGDEDGLRRFFGTVRRLDTVRLDTDAVTANQGVPVWLCGEPVRPWPELWDRMHRP